MLKHDQARAHIATASIEILEEFNNNIIELPPKWVDLSPIELCFAEIQRRAKEYGTNIKTQDKIWDYVKDILFKKDFKEFM